MFVKTPYSETTHGIQIDAAPVFLPKESDLSRPVYTFLYGIRMTNHNDFSVKLVSRKWAIRDGNQQEKIVDGPGVVGKFPLIAPKGTFQYTSFCPLSTPTGSMRGEYTFSIEEGNTAPPPTQGHQRKNLVVVIPLFFLRSIDRLDQPSGLYQNVKVEDFYPAGPN